MKKWVYTVSFLLVWSSLATFAFAQTTTLKPDSLTTYGGGVWAEGSIGSGQTETNLHVADLTGSNDSDWDKYVEFIAVNGRYGGERAYYLPNDVDRDNLGTLQVDIRYRGPEKDTQRWIWYIYNWTAGKWVYIGDNRDAASWGDWETFTFIPNGEPADYVDPSTRKIRVRHQSQSAVDNMTLDYEAVVVHEPDSTYLISSHRMVTHANNVWRGITGYGQDYDNLHVQDQSTDDEVDWDKYVEFITKEYETGDEIGRYSGFRQYNLPNGVDKNEIVSLKVHLNYRGPTTPDQYWSWQLLKWKTDTEQARWVTIGNNAGVPSWEWTSMTFNAHRVLGEYTYADFVHPTNNRTISLRLVSNNAFDNMNLDYEAIEIGLGDAGDVPDEENDWWRPTKGLTWWWHIEDTENLNTNLDVDVYNIDLFDISDNQLTTLKDNGKKIICYFSAGTYEPWRTDFPNGFGDDGSPYIGSKMLDWDEWWLNITLEEQELDVIKQVMRDRLDLAADRGCDGVEFDNIDAYQNIDGYEYTNWDTGVTTINPDGITAQDQLDWNRFLADAAHERGLAAGLKNDTGQISQLVDDFDFAVNEQCFQYNECDTYLPFLDANKPVFAQEYGEDTDVSENRFNSAACTKFNQLGIDALWKYSFNLDGNGVEDCR